jgi:hypothetical protein
MDHFGLRIIREPWRPPAATAPRRPGCWAFPGPPLIAKIEKYGLRVAARVQSGRMSGRGGGLGGKPPAAKGRGPLETLFFLNRFDAVPTGHAVILVTAPCPIPFIRSFYGLSKN